jgi:hypothetical protein
MRSGEAMELLLTEAFPAPTARPDWETQLLKALGYGSARLVPLRKPALSGTRGGMPVPRRAEAA